ncbi:hypothetical protein LX32DRAFT_642966 [Colletotrichum zoysiae]|uniref:Uncharacterized protein n=1 Tax=Colletotrichum zoysiae TaxID=1216348 RepID=A0AAD9HB75_9PEZI|nr:hypothetical protein LX32DRAFT_642966 [Colletotrichum zoysiae]
MGAYVRHTRSSDLPAGSFPPPAPLSGSCKQHFATSYSTEHNACYETLAGDPHFAGDSLLTNPLRQRYLRSH